MIKIKQKKQVSKKSITIYLLLLFFSCHINSRKLDTNYDDVWLQGKKLFFKDCGYCHTPASKDHEFKKYNRVQRTNKNAYLSKILKNNIHLQEINTNNYSQTDINALNKFIRLPKRTLIIE